MFQVHSVEEYSNSSKETCIIMLCYSYLKAAYVKNSDFSFNKTLKYLRWKIMAPNLNTYIKWISKIVGA